jgi:endonuclease/exonuclease/phosphatase family metal-dependent hydrolase
MPTLKIMTFNVAWCQFGLDKVAAHIREQSPDLVVLQEVDRGTPPIFRSAGEDQAQELARKTNLPYQIFGKTHDYRTLFNLGFAWGEVGNAILSSRPLRGATVHAVPSSRNWQFDTSYLQTSVTAAGVTHEVVCMHWGRNDEWVPSRTKAIEVVNAIPAGTPLIVAGDFNSTADDPDFQSFSSLLTDAASSIPEPNPCFNVRGFGRRIDFIFFRGPYQVKSVVLLCTEPHPSDHPSLVAELEFPTSPSIPTLAVSVQPYPIPVGVPVQVIVSAQDQTTRAPITGDVIIDDNVVAVTNVVLTYTFNTRTVMTFDENGRRTGLETVYPIGVVTAPNYSPTDIDFGFPRSP